jgi:hypothetical protein
MLTKMEVARRQLDTAIRLTFSGEDPVSIHTIANAARQVIRDFCEARGDIASFRRIDDVVKPGHVGEFWAAINRSGNFFKHGDRDPTAIHDWNEGEPEFAILFSIRWYCDLGFPPTSEMTAFMRQFAERHPNLLAT